jgi:hypothetical protein
VIVPVKHRVDHRFRRMQKTIFIILTIIVAGALLGFDSAQGSDDLVVAVDKSVLVKVLGMAGLGLLAEIWRNQRSQFKTMNDFGQELKELKGFCKGKNADCGES